jgi:hypothetical protein
MVVPKNGWLTRTMVFEGTRHKRHIVTFRMINYHISGACVPPSLNGLRAFEAAVCHMSFTRVAEERRIRRPFHRAG